MKIIYDNLIFVTRNIKKIKIPNFFKKIDQYAIKGCNSLIKIQISMDSQLQSFELGSFSSCSIKLIQIPPLLTKIDNYAFGYCEKLVSVNFPENSNLKIIGENAFEETSIKSISIPSNVKKLAIVRFIIAFIFKLLK